METPGPRMDRTQHKRLVLGSGDRSCGGGLIRGCDGALIRAFWTPLDASSGLEADLLALGHWNKYASTSIQIVELAVMEYDVHFLK